MAESSQSAGEIIVKLIRRRKNEGYEETKKV
jgi:hypothetical protein